MGAFTLRRLVLVAAAALPAGGCARRAYPSVTIITPARNEEVNLPDLLTALDALQYPADRLHFVFTNDGSHDGTSAVLKSWTARHPAARVIDLPESVGKASAMNRALAVAPETELVAVYDADLRPRPDSLERLVAVFEEPRVGAAAGYRRPWNAARNSIAAYSALESIVHQLVTQAGKEKLHLNPTTLGGNCVYRRSALLAVGGFPPDSFSEDIEVSLALIAASWSTRFCRHAIADALMPESLRRYWNQRARWTRGIYTSSRRASCLEAWLVSAGYADRLVFLAALALAAAGRLAPLWLALYFVAPVAAVCMALGRSDAGLKALAKMSISVVPMFAVDVAATLAASGNALLRRPLVWHTGHSQT